MKKSTLVIGVIGADCHAVGNKVLDRVFTAHDFHVINLGVMVSQMNILMPRLKQAPMPSWCPLSTVMATLTVSGYVSAASNRGLGDILLYVGGNLVVGKHDFGDVEVKFKEMGFNRVFAPSHDTEDVCALITNDIRQHNGLEQRCTEEAI